VAARVVARASRAAGHAATSLPGLVVEAMAPDAVRREAASLAPVAVVAGTNGKTTTARLLARIVGEVLGPPVVNASGANLRQSIASSILLRPMRQDGRRSPAVFEVDELALPAVVGDVEPSVIVATNLFRDQLDRYGEIQVILDRWREMLVRLGPRTTLVYCADDARLAMLAADAGVRAVTFGLAWHAAGAAEPLDVGALTPDPVSCTSCGQPLQFERRSIGHLGRFACPGGHARWASPDVTFVLRDGDDIARVDLTTRGEQAAFSFALTGISAGYDAAAAAAAASVLGVSLADAAASLDGATSAFGRSEDLDVGGRRLVLALGKNPASLSEATALAARIRPSVVVLALNDAFADGRDVSWIWDAEIGPLLAARAVILAGRRARDLELRVKYDVDADRRRTRTRVVDSLEDAVTTALGGAGVGETILIVATYTALLAIRRGLVERGLADAAPQ
jgi:UDP-N-acetylmuramyl tripeptide synthase